jgi:hypothetical protein
METPKIEYYLAYYINYGDFNEHGDMETKLECVPIPIRLKEKYLEKFNDKPQQNKEKIFKFLEENE